MSSSWVRDLSASLVQSASEIPIEPALIQGGWEISSRVASSDGGVSFTAKKQEIDYAEVLSDLWEFFKTEYEKGNIGSAEGILTKIESLKNAAILAFNGFTVPDVSTENIDFSTKAKSFDFTPKTSASGISVGNITIPITNIESFTVDGIEYAEDMNNLNEALSEYKITIDKLKVDLEKILDDYEAKLKVPAQIYNKDIESLRKEILEKFASHDAEISELLTHWGDSQRDRIELKFKEVKENAQQGLIDRGLYNSGIWNTSIVPGIERQKEIALTDVEDKIIERRLGVDSQLYQELRQIQDSFVAILERMKQHDFEAVTVIFSKITYATDAYINAQKGYIDSVMSLYLQKRKLVLSASELDLSYKMQKAQIEAQLNMKRGELDSRIEELRTNAKISTKEISTKVDELILKGKIASADSDLKLDEMNFRAELAKAETATKIDQIKAQLASLELEKLKNQAQVELALKDAYELALKMFPSFDSISNVLGAAANIKRGD